MDIIIHVCLNINHIVGHPLLNSDTPLVEIKIYERRNFIRNIL